MVAHYRLRIDVTLTLSETATLYSDILLSVELDGLCCIGGLWKCVNIYVAVTWPNDWLNPTQIQYKLPPATQAGCFTTDNNIAHN